MIEWIYINSEKISKVAYNKEIKTMYIDFIDSNVDTPYAGVTEAIFTAFCEAKNTDEFFKIHIKDCFEKIDINTENSINCRL